MLRKGAKKKKYVKSASIFHTLLANLPNVLVVTFLTTAVAASPSGHYPRLCEFTAFATQIKSRVLLLRAMWLLSSGSQFCLWSLFPFNVDEHKRDC